MSKKKLSTFLFLDEWFDDISKMSEAECKQFMMALKAFREKGTMAQFGDRYMQSIFMRAAGFIATNEEKYIEKREKLLKNFRAKLEKAKQYDVEAAAKPKPTPEPKPKASVPEPQPIEPTPEPAPPPSYESFFQQPEESLPQPTEAKPSPEPPKPNEPPTYTTAKVGDVLVMNGKRVVKRTNGVFVIPTLEEVTDYINEKGYHFQASTFLEYYENSKPHPWHMANGNPVKAWKQCCTTFEQHIYLSEGKRAMARQQQLPTSHAHDNINEKQYEPPY